MPVQRFTKTEFQQLNDWKRASHKGENGRLLVIGGSKLFHASIFWTADVASRFVDLVHFASPTKENSDLVRYKMKSMFWNGIVVDWNFIDTYIDEDDAIIIGPGMPRDEGLIGQESKTSEIVDGLISRAPNKRWIIDGGAIQEINPELINENHIITPHQGECERLLRKINHPDLKIEEYKKLTSAINNPRAKHFDTLADFLRELSFALNGATILLKGVRDIVVDRENSYVIEGGNEGLTKGGTGDVLAGIVGALSCNNPKLISAAAGSLLIKSAADKLYDTAGTYYNTTDLVDAVSYVMKDFSTSHG